MAHGVDGRPVSAMALAVESSVSYAELAPGECMPFTIEPSSGIVKVGGEQHFIVRFSPLDVVDFNAVLTAR